MASSGNTDVHDNSSIPKRGLSRARVIAFWSVILLGVAPLALFIAAGAAEDRLVMGDFDAVSKDGSRGLFEDFIFLTYFVSIPSTVAIISLLWVRLNRAVDSVEKLLAEAKTQPSHAVSKEFAYARETYDRFRFAKSESAGGFRTRRTLLLILRIGMHAAGLAALAKSTADHVDPVNAYGFEIWSSWKSQLCFWGRFVFEVVSYVFVLPCCFFRLVLSCLCIDRLMQAISKTSSIPFMRFSPDHAGGLSNLGRLAIWHAFMLAPLTVMAGVYAWTYPIQLQLAIGVASLVLAYPLVFMLPLLSSRRALLKSQQREMQRLARRFNSLLAEENIDRVTKHGGQAEFAAMIQSANESKDVWEHLSSDHCWPFNRRILARMIAMFAGAIFAIGPKVLFELYAGLRRLIE